MGVENASGTQATQVIYNNPGSLYSGNGTYYFTSSAASPLAGDYLGDTTLSSWVASPLVFDLGVPVISPTFSLVRPDGSLFGNPELYDGGAHSDGEAGDGLYGGWYYPPANGTVCFQVDGPTQGGETFRRIDLTPLRYQGMELIRPYPGEQFALPGATVIYTYTLWNDSDSGYLFVPQLQSSQGWATTPAIWYWVGAHDFAYVPITVDIPFSADNVTGRSTLTILGGGMSDSGTVETTVRGPVTWIEMAAIPERIGPDGRTSTIMVHVQDDLGWNVANGTVVDLNTTLGTLDRLQSGTVSGLVPERPGPGLCRHPAERACPRGREHDTDALGHGDHRPRPAVQHLLADGVPQLAVRTESPGAHWPEIFSAACFSFRR